MLDYQIQSASFKPMRSHLLTWVVQFKISFLDNLKETVTLDKNSFMESPGRTSKEHP